MLVLTAGNARYRDILKISLNQIERLGLHYRLYDLGHLGQGKRWFGVRQEQKLLQDGVYWHNEHNYPTKALHKPHLVQDTLQDTQDFVLYIDGDAVLMGHVNEVVTDDYDIGVTTRRQSELENTILAKPGWKDWLGQFNAGVIFFNRGEGSREFVQRWVSETERVRNDQYALNRLANPAGRRVEAGEVWSEGGIRFKSFDGDVYNNSHFMGPDRHRAKIFHFKNMSWQRNLREIRILCNQRGRHESHP